MLKLNNRVDPHLGNRILYSGSKIQDAKQALILIHGRGSSADSIIPLADELNLNDTVVIAPQADQHTWYPFRFIEKREKNEPGITSGLTLIDSIIIALNQDGIKTENIFILGFSQGACLTLDYVARHPKKFGGVFALSGGLIGDKLDSTYYNGNMEATPIFLGCSDNDFHIPESRVHESAEILEGLSAVVTKKIYPGMGHRISKEEIDEINKILAQHKNAEEYQHEKL